MSLWIRLGLNAQSVLLVMQSLNKSVKNEIADMLNAAKEALGGIKVGIAVIKNWIVEITNEFAEIKSDVAEIKGICLNMDKFLASEKGQARIRELRQSRQARSAGNTGPNGCRNAVGHRVNSRAPVQGQKTPTRPSCEHGSV